jgi:hypothetical protein
VFQQHAVGLRLVAEANEPRYILVPNTPEHVQLTPKLSELDLQVTTLCEKNYTNSMHN